MYKFTLQMQGKEAKEAYRDISSWEALQVASRIAKRLADHPVVLFSVERLIEVEVEVEEPEKIQMGGGV